ncbi:MAG: HEAT repeat domain-containing protein [Bacteroidota bacterium]
MEKHKVDELIDKYNAGVADPAELQQLERMMEEGAVALTQLRDLQRLDDQLMRMEPPRTSLQMDDRFYEMLAEEKRKSKPVGFAWPGWNWLAPRLAFAAALLVAGFLGGYWLQQPAEKKEVAALTQEVTELKEMMMLTLLEKESATDRLRAVGLTNEMDQASQKVTRALIHTLNNDENVNVRLAALDALKAYARDNKVREELVRAIAKQQSPLVQVALAEVMVALQEKKSVTELQKLLEDDRTPEEVKSRIKESIEVLI